MNVKEITKVKSAFIAVLAVAALVLAFAVSAFASEPPAEQTDPEPQVNPTTGLSTTSKGTLTITKLIGNETETDGTGLVQSPGNDPLEGVKYKVQRTHSYDPITGQMTLLPEPVDVTATTEATNNKGVLTFTNLDLGRYTVQELDEGLQNIQFGENGARLDPQIDNPREKDGVVTYKTYVPDTQVYTIDIPLFDNNGQVHMVDGNAVTDIYLYPKNSELVSSKTESKDDVAKNFKIYTQDKPLVVDVGVPYYYQVESAIPADFKLIQNDEQEEVVNYSEISFSDTLVPEVIYYKDPAKAAKQEVTAQVLIETEKGSGTFEEVPANMVTISEPEDKADKSTVQTVSAVVKLDWLKNSIDTAPGKKMVLRFQATLDESLIDKSKGTVTKKENTAEVTYKFGFNGESKNLKTPYTWTKPRSGKLKLEKVDADKEETKLEGVKFGLYRIVDKQTLKQEGVFDKTPAVIPVNGENLTVDGKELQGILISDKLTDKFGLAEWNALVPGDYYLVEKETLAEYNLLPEALYVKVEASEPTSEVSAIDITISNIKKGKLPKTGGIGTPLFIIGGTFLMGSAVYFLFRNRREQN